MPYLYTATAPSHYIDYLVNHWIGKRHRRYGILVFHGYATRFYQPQRHD